MAADFEIIKRSKVILRILDFATLVIFARPIHRRTSRLNSTPPKPHPWGNPASACVFSRFFSSLAATLRAWVIERVSECVCGWCFTTFLRRDDDDARERHSTRPRRPRHQLVLPFLLAVMCCVALLNTACFHDGLSPSWKHNAYVCVSHKHSSLPGFQRAPAQKSLFR